MTAYSDEVVSDAPFRYWRFEEASGLYHTTTGTDSATMFGTPSRVLPGVGDSDRSVGFPTVNDYVQLGAAGSIPTTAKRASFTWEAWFKVPALTPVDTGQASYQLMGTNARIDAFTRHSWGFEMRRDTGVDIGKIEASVSSGSDRDIARSSNRLDDNKFHHIVATYDGANLRLYVDGALKSTAAHAAAVNAGTNAPVLGRMHPGFTNPTTYPANAFPGIIDEVAVYETVLSPTRILNHFDIGSTIYAKWYLYDGSNSIRLQPTIWNGTAAETINTEIAAAYVPSATYGVPSGTTMTTLTTLNNPYPSNTFPTSHRYRIAGNGTFTGWRFNHRVEVLSGTVSFVNCHFAGSLTEGPVADSALLDVMTSGTATVTATRCTFNPDAPNASQDAVKGHKLTLDACDLTHTVSGVKISGTGAATVKNSWIHGLPYYDTGTSNIGISSTAGNTLLFQNNLLQGSMNSGGIVVTQSTGASSGVIIDGNRIEISGNASDIDVDDHIGTTAITGLQIKNNLFTRDLAKNQMLVSSRSIRYSTTVYTNNGWVDGNSTIPKVFAHYVPTYPISIENNAPASDYYTTQLLSVTGESSAHVTYGGLLRDRPVEQTASASIDWRKENLVKEINQAAASGVDGFFVDVLALSGVPWTDVVLMLDASLEASRYFNICPQIDATATGIGSQTTAAIASSMATLAAHPNTLRLITGEFVLSAYAAEQKTAAYWTQILTYLRNDYAIPTVFYPIFVDTSTMSTYASISHGHGNWGSRNPGTTTSAPNFSSTAHGQGLKFANPVSVQHSSPKGASYYEAGNLAQLRAAWNRVLADSADHVLMATWNNYPENSGFGPSKNHDYAFLDVNAYYLARFKNGAYPAITQDAVYLTHRKQLFATAWTDSRQTIGQTLGNSGTNPALNTVEAMVFLTAPATVGITTGGANTNFSAPAGVSQYTVTAAAGVVSATVTRSATLVASTSTSTPLNATPATQDLEYVAAGSLRQPATLPVATNPLPFAPALPGSVAPPRVAENPV